MSITEVERWQKSVGLAGSGASLTWTGAQGKVLAVPGDVTANPSESAGRITMVTGAYMETTASFSSVASPALIAFHVYKADFGTGYLFSMNGNTAVRGYTTNGQLAITHAGGEWDIPMSGNVNNNKYVIIQFDGSTSRAWVDGTEASTTGTKPGSGLTFAAQPFSLKSYTGDVSTATGEHRHDNWAFYSGLASAGEITALITATANGGTALPTGGTLQKRVGGLGLGAGLAR